MKNILLTLISFAFTIPCIVKSDDIYDKRESALTAMKQAKTILKNAETVIEEAAKVSSSMPEPGKSTVKKLSQTVTPALKQIRNNISMVADTVEETQQITDDVAQVSDAAQKVINNFNSGMKDVGAKLDGVQKGAGNLSIPKADAAQMEQIKAEITESLNSAGIKPAVGNKKQNK